MVKLMFINFNYLIIQGGAILAFSTSFYDFESLYAGNFANKTSSIHLETYGFFQTNHSKFNNEDSSTSGLFWATFCFEIRLLDISFEVKNFFLTLIINNL